MHHATTEVSGSVLSRLWAVPKPGKGGSIMPAGASSTSSAPSVWLDHGSLDADGDGVSVVGGSTLSASALDDLSFAGQGVDVIGAEGVQVVSDGSSVELGSSAARASASRVMDIVSGETLSASSESVSVSAGSTLGVYAGDMWENRDEGPEAVLSAMTKTTQKMQSVFGDRWYGELQWNAIPEQHELNNYVIQMHKEFDIPFKCFCLFDLLSIGPKFMQGKIGSHRDTNCYGLRKHIPRTNNISQKIQ